MTEVGLQDEHYSMVSIYTTRVTLTDTQVSSDSTFGPQHKYIKNLIFHLNTLKNTKHLPSLLCDSAVLNQRTV